MLRKTYEFIKSKRILISSVLTVCIVIIVVSVFLLTEESIPVITYPAQKENYKVSVFEEGILEAKENRQVQVPMTPSRRPTITYLIPEGTEVKKDEVIAVFEDVELTKDYKNSVDELELAKAEADRKRLQLKIQRLTLESQLKTTEASLQASQLQLKNLSFLAGNIREKEKLNIQISELELKKVQKKISSLDNIEKEENDYMQVKIRQANIKYESSKRFLDQLTVKAPIDGIVIYEKNRITRDKYQEGDAVGSGWPFLKIPNTSVMQVELKVNETSAQKIKKGQSAVVTVSSAGDFNLTGKVAKVDKIATPVKRGSKIKKVGVIVEIDSMNTGLLPGLTGECSIIVEELQENIIIPQECIFEHDSIKIVYVQDKNKYIPQAVEIIHQHDDFVAIKSSLNGNEQLALQEPGNSSVLWTDEIKKP